MNADQAYRIIYSNLSTVVSCMLTVQKGTKVDVYCDSSGRMLSFSKPSGDANIKLCSIKAPDLGGSYGLYRRGDAYRNPDRRAPGAQPSLSQGRDPGPAQIAAMSGYSGLIQAMTPCHIGGGMLKTGDVIEVKDLPLWER